jgi:glycerophosphoryl diester phosphodiesterase
MAFKEENVDGIEVDLRMTSDYEIILHHDEISQLYKT